MIGLNPGDPSEKLPGALVLRRGHRAGDGIMHESVGKVPCPFCGADRGVPCRTLENRNTAGAPYTRTHIRRINAWIWANRHK